MDPLILNTSPRKILPVAPVEDAGPAPVFSTNPFMQSTPISTLAASIPQSPLPNAVHSQAVDNSNELHRLQATGSGVSQIENPWLRGVARVADTVGSFVAPNLTRVIPGSTLKHRDDITRQEGIVANDQTQQRNDQVIADDQALATQRAASAERLQSQANENKTFTLTPDQADAAGVPELAGVPVSARTYQRFVGAHEGHQTQADIAAGKNDTALQKTQMHETAATDRAQSALDSRESIAESANKTRQLIAQMHDSTSTANSMRAHSGTATRTAANGQTYKVPADISKRAALADNVVENANAVESIVNEHPDIVGASGGRYTNVQQMIGSDDPNIAALGIRMHNIALASNGAHGVRAQGAIEQTEKELFNHFKSGPNAIKSGLSATKDSMQTFLNDERNYTESGSRKGSSKPQGGEVIIVKPEDLR